MFGEVLVTLWKVQGASLDTSSKRSGRRCHVTKKDGMRQVDGDTNATLLFKLFE